MISFLPKTVALIALLLCTACQAVLQSENVAVVINADSADSKAVANCFIELRDIPPINVIYLKLGEYDQPKVIEVEQFRQTILQPVLDEIDQRKLVGKIDCIAWSCGIPAEINISTDLKSSSDPRLQQDHVTNIASITGLTFLYQLTQRKDARYVLPGINFYACRGKYDKYTGQQLTDAQTKLYIEASKLYDEGRILEARQLCNQLLREVPKSIQTRILLAKLLVESDLSDRVADILWPLVRAGWGDYEAITSQPKLVELAKHHKEMSELLQTMHRIQHTGGAHRPTGFFSNRIAWTPNGPNTKDGLHYMLSIVLSVDGPRGLTADQATAVLRRAASADYNRPAGNIYYMINRDIRSITRSWGFLPALQALEKLGPRGQISEGTLPPSRTPIAGLMAGSAILEIQHAQLEISPGAICEHLTSHGGVLQSWASQTPLRDFLLAGAAGSGGTVTEPRAIQAKFPTPFMHCHYVAGCTLVEAFFQSITGPYQYLVVGDPLCKPWATQLGVELTGITDGQVLSGDKLEIQPICGGMDAKILGSLAYVDGVMHATAKAYKPLTLDLSSLAEGYHSLSVTVVMADTIQSKNQRHLNFQIDRGSGQLSAAILNESNITTADSVMLQASMEAAEKIEFFHNSRLLATINSPSGIAQFPAELPGAGKITIVPVAKLKNADSGQAARKFRGLPIELNILPAPKAADADKEGVLACK